jgi:C1A family cysteine protease
MAKINPLFMTFLLLVSASTIESVVYTGNFTNWFSKFENHYKNYNKEHIFENWLSNDRHIVNTNVQNLPYTLDHNVYSGLNAVEFSEMMGFKYNSDQLKQKYIRGFSDVPIVTESPSDLSIEALPTSVDWRKSNAVTAVKDQGNCGSCWSFSTTGALEGIYSIKNKFLNSFSEQQLVDCDSLTNGGRDHGCNGGLMDTAFSWINKNGGLCLEGDYPYVSGKTQTAGVCQKTCKNVVNSQIKSYVDLQVSDQSMMTALSQQPVSIAIEADQKDFQLYSTGVFTSQTCGTSLDHGVLLVGYGTDAGNDYYIMKNSWSSSWGESGYMRMGKGSQYNKGQGQCGLLMSASYPNL